MARKKPQYNGLFDLGFPIHTRVGQDKVKEILYGLNENHASRVARVQDYLSKELDSVGNTTFSKVGSVLNHNAEDLSRIRGNTDVRHTGVIMHAVARMMPIEQRTKQRMGFDQTRPIDHQHKPQATIVSSGQIVDYYNAKDCNTAFPGSHDVYVPHGSPPPPNYTVFYGSGPLVNPSPSGQFFNPYMPCVPPGVGVPSPVSQPISPTTPTQCPQCGCPITIDDLFKAPGSSCQQPLYIVLCSPKRVDVCPPPANGEAATPQPIGTLTVPTTPTVPFVEPPQAEFVPSATTPQTPTGSPQYGAAQQNRPRFFGPLSAFKLSPTLPTAE